MADPLEVARGESREETGLDAAKMTYAGHLFEEMGRSDAHGEMDTKYRED